MGDIGKGVRSLRDGLKNDNAEIDAKTAKKDEEK